jgi:diaminohydroxyphosphoribosylaminopyrimidine deaminase/5-amino-6-(5-phosphoribosylamino)uracil reductase
MLRAIALADSIAFTSPNPRVGAVLVRGEEVVGEGTHRGAGHPHAEIEALEAADHLEGSTLYVNLEPCVHHGRMPPCAPAVVRSGIERVVIAHEDPDPRVAGRGIRALRAAGIEVTTGVLEAAAREINIAYLTHRITGRSFVRLKLALSLDGRLAAPDGSARWITGRGARRRAHEGRARADAILVGAGTVLADDPSLTAREVGSDRQPIRIVVDGAGRVPASARLFSEPGDCILATTRRAPHDVVLAWKEAGADVIVVDEGEDEVSLPALLDELGRRDLLEIYCEGGARLATSLLSQGLVDRLEIHRGAVLIGEGGPAIGELAHTMDDASRWRVVSDSRIEDDLVTIYAPAGAL